MDRHELGGDHGKRDAGIGAFDDRVAYARRRGVDDGGARGAQGVYRLRDGVERRDAVDRSAAAARSRQRDDVGAGRGMPAICALP